MAITWDEIDRITRRILGCDQDETTVTLAAAGPDAPTTIPAAEYGQAVDFAASELAPPTEGTRNVAPPACLPVPADYDYNQYRAALIQQERFNQALAGWSGADANLASQSAIEPKLTAEQLLHKVLPQDLYIHLNAVGYFWLEPTRTKRLEVRHLETKQVIGHPPYRYQFFRGKKTHLHEGKNVYSSCIAPENTSCPDQDRLVAEYLLAKDREKEYLATTNLTCLNAPVRLPTWALPQRVRDAGLQMQQHIALRQARVVQEQAYERQYRDMILGLAGIRQPELLTITQIALECMRIIERTVENEVGNGWPWLRVPLNTPNTQVIGINLDIPAEAKSRSLDECSERHLRVPMSELGLVLARRRHEIIGIIEPEMSLLTNDMMQYARTVATSGLVVLVGSDYDIQRNVWLTRVSVQVALSQ